MDLFTIQVGRFRIAAKRKVEFLDTTVKSGLKIFSPTWDMVLGHKDGSVSDEEYTTRYRARMRQSWIDNREQWEAILRKEEPIALACYCKPGKFCHRLLLKDMFKELCEKLNIPYRYYGELEP